jgi:hypothetical protein
MTVPGNLGISIELWESSSRGVMGLWTTVTRVAHFSPSPSIGVLPIIVHISFYDPPPTENMVLDRLNAMRQRLPYGENNENFFLHPILHVDYGLGLGDWEGWRRLLTAIGNYPYTPTAAAPPGLEVFRCAFVSHSPEFDAINLAGIGLYRPFVPHATCVNAVTSNFRFDVDALTHETGHALGLNHTRCMRSVPVPYDAWLPSFTEEPGWSAAENRLIPENSGDMMGYCDPRWPSITAYNYFLNNRTHRF